VFISQALIREKTGEVIFWKTYAQDKQGVSIIPHKTTMTQTLVRVVAENNDGLEMLMVILSILVCRIVFVIVIQ
jgi:hypothetical protein